MQVVQTKPRRVLDRALIGGIVLLVLIVVGAEIAHSAELLPSIGFTRPAGGGDSKVSTGLALRSGLLPMVQSEIGVSYRKEEFSGGGAATTWPVTASLWFAPIPNIYAGGGAGVYITKYDYDQDEIPFPVDDETSQDFGVHLGGGLRFPLAPSASIDLHGRYVMLREKDSQLVPEQFDPDFWMAKAGIAFGF